MKQTVILALVLASLAGCGGGNNQTAPPVGPSRQEAVQTIDAVSGSVAAIKRSGGANFTLSGSITLIPRRKSAVNDPSLKIARITLQGAFAPSGEASAAGVLRLQSKRYPFSFIADQQKIYLGRDGEWFGRSREGLKGGPQVLLERVLGAPGVTRLFGTPGALTQADAGKSVKVNGKMMKKLTVAVDPSADSSLSASEREKLNGASGEITLTAVLDPSSGLPAEVSLTHQGTLATGPLAIANTKDYSGSTTRLDVKLSGWNSPQLMSPPASFKPMPDRLAIALGFIPPAAAGLPQTPPKPAPARRSKKASPGNPTQSSPPAGPKPGAINKLLKQLAKKPKKARRGRPDPGFNPPQGFRYRKPPTSPQGKRGSAPPLPDAPAKR